MKAIRGATTIKANTAAEIRSCTLELLQQIMDSNHVQAEDLISVMFTATKDIDAAYPAKYARELPGWDNVPLSCMQEMDVVGSLPLCIRVLCLADREGLTAVQHIYLREAQKLRPDLAAEQGK